MAGRARYRATPRQNGERALLRRQLAADLAALVGVGVDVDVALAALELLHLRRGHRTRAGDRAGEGGAEIDRHPGIAAGRGAAMDMGAGRRTAEPVIFDAPGCLVGGGVG